MRAEPVGADPGSPAPRSRRPAGLISASAPNSLARASRSALVSSAITRAPMALASSVADKPDRPLAEDRDGVVALQTEPVQRAPGGAGAAGNRGAGLEGQLVRQRHQRARRTFHVSRVRAVAGGAVDLGDAFDAQLHPAGRAMRADAAAAIVVLHHAHADPRLLLGHARRRPRPPRRRARARRSPARRCVLKPSEAAPPAAR